MAVRLYAYKTTQLFRKLLEQYFYLGAPSTGRKTLPLCGASFPDIMLTFVFSFLMREI